MDRNIENSLENKNSQLNFEIILEKIKKTTTDVISSPETVALIWESITDMRPLINEAKKKEILNLLESSDINSKINILLEISQKTNEEGISDFEKKEVPYIERFVMYSIVTDILDKVINSSSVDVPHQIWENYINNLWIDQLKSKMLLELITKNEKNYIKHFWYEYISKIKIRDEAVNFDLTNLNSESIVKYKENNH